MRSLSYRLLYCALYNFVIFWLVISRYLSKECCIVIHTAPHVITYVTCNLANLGHRTGKGFILLTAECCAFRCLSGCVLDVLALAAFPVESGTDKVLKWAG